MTHLRKKNIGIIFFLTAFYLMLAIRTAWLSDDAMITFRVVENFLAGYGLGYNPFVRVQAFTHPLWFFVISFFYYLSGFFVSSMPNGLFNITIFLSVLFSSLAIFLLLTRVAQPEVLPLVSAALVLCLSSSFIDYSTSGLENPLTHFLLVVFVIVYLMDAPNLIRLSFISSLVMLNRLDAVLLIGPAILYSWWINGRTKRGFIQIMVGFIPIILWEIFSIFYFGFPFPNTAYAKLNTDISSGALILQGMDYLLNSINWDTLVIFTVIVAGVLIYLKMDKKAAVLYAGVLLYIVYIIKIGGDFMAGRFMAAPLLLSVAIISNQPVDRANRLTIIGLTILLGAFSIRSPLLSSNAVLYMPGYSITDNNGVSDQRLHYFGNERKGQYNSLVENGFRKPVLGSKFAGTEWQFTGFQSVYVADALGKPGYGKGPNIYVIDNYALADPLLARLPAQSDWEIGHFVRTIPEGYLETLETGENVIADPSLALYYSKLNYVISAPLFDWERIMEVLKFNTGQYEYLVEDYTGSMPQD